jgi:hypothetical protein
MDRPKNCPVCDGVDTFEEAGAHSLGFVCRDCDFNAWQDADGRWQPKLPREWFDRSGALASARSGVSLLLHHADLLNPSERRQTLGRINFELKLLAPPVSTNGR